jgi:ADP-ribose pyrophosphatase YjhB (NUDIX family)
MYNEIVKLIKVISCGCCVYRVNNGVPEILLVRPFQEKDAWGIPKGHIEEGETHEACAIRETVEETSIVPILGVALPVVSTKYRNEIKYVYSFLARPQDELASPVGTDNENIDMRYFPITALPKLHRYQISLLDAAVRMIKDIEASNV